MVEARQETGRVYDTRWHVMIRLELGFSTTIVGLFYFRYVSLHLDCSESMVSPV